MVFMRNGGKKYVVFLMYICQQAQAGRPMDNHGEVCPAFVFSKTKIAYMKKKNIALVAGGDSGEYVISVASARMIRENIDPERYTVYLIMIRQRKWVYVGEKGQEVPVDKNDFSVLVDGQKILFDCVFITIHGTPGEDGKLQAYFELLGIPYTTAGVLASALTFNKHYCNMVVAHLGFPVPASVRLKTPANLDVEKIIQQVKLPVFVKPNEGGSSIGMSMVKDKDALLPAIEAAFEQDKQVLIEEYLQGTELTCGVFRYRDKVTALPVTEIISKTKAAFFDFEAKYTPGAADEITPARISPALTKMVREHSAILYDKLGMSGLVRFDFIHCNNTLYFLEVNVTPGMTETSIVPQQAAVENISSMELFSMLIEEALSGR